MPSNKDLPEDERVPINCIADLSPEDRAEVVRLFREAAAHQAAKWDCEDMIETLMGREIEFNMDEWADGEIDEEDVARDLDDPNAGIKHRSRQWRGNNQPNSDGQ